MALAHPSIPSPPTSTRPLPNEVRRVKAYELRHGDWHDRGTGYSSGHKIHDIHKVFVEAEDDPSRIILETLISKNGAFQRQSETLIVWTESNGTDMALSFQEPEGCTSIWDFVTLVQQHLQAISGPVPSDDNISDDAMDTLSPQPVTLPPAELANVFLIEATIRQASSTQHGRETLTRFLLTEDYTRRLVALVDVAEQLEDLPDLQRLSNTMKMLILLNDQSIIEQMVSDSLILGVVGALEYDHEFGEYKANHRQYLQHGSRFKEVVRIDDPVITRKIHATWRLQYLKDVVLARILDDPTFQVLNGIIFYNQLDIVSYIQNNVDFLRELFSLFESPDSTHAQRKDAILFIQQCSAIAKNLQATNRQNLYSNFVANGLLDVIVFALGQREAPIRIAGTDILVAMIDHDPGMVRTSIVKATADKQNSLTDTVIELLLVENDLGVKAQAADAIKVLLDPQQFQPPEPAARAGEQGAAAKPRPPPPPNPQTEAFVQEFYENGAAKLFRPLQELKGRTDLSQLSVQQVSLHSHLIEVLMYFIRQHGHRAKFFIASESIMARVRQFLSAPHKHLQLVALKFFRTCLGLHDEWYFVQLNQHHIFGPILDIVEATMPRNNLLNSACLELFEFIKREGLKLVLNPLVEESRDRLLAITYVDTFEALVLRYDQIQQFGDAPIAPATLQPNANGSPGVAGPGLLNHKINGSNQRWQGVREMDAEEEQYFNTSDDEDELATTSPKQFPPVPPNGVLASSKPLVDYSDDEEEEEDVDHEDEPAAFSHVESESDAVDDTQLQSVASHEVPPDAPASPPATPPFLPERLSEKRRRQAEDEDDELGKLTSTKRRSSSASSTGSIEPTSSASDVADSSGSWKTGSSRSTGNHHTLRRQKSFASNRRDGHAGGNAPRKIAISLTVKKPRPAPKTATATTTTATSTTTTMALDDPNEFSDPEEPGPAAAPPVNEDELPVDGVT